MRAGDGCDLTLAARSQGMQSPCPRDEGLLVTHHMLNQLVV